MIDLKRFPLSVVRQCTLLRRNRSGGYDYRPTPPSETKAGVHASDQRALPGGTVLWLTADDVASAASRS